MDTDFSQSVLLYNLRVGEAGVRRDARVGGGSALQVVVQQKAVLDKYKMDLDLWIPAERRAEMEKAHSHDGTRGSLKRRKNK
ncbi:hypothetical protein P4284_13485 [Bacillus swezeyi]|uniref:hypothetical protein n=1 Tax=Bacillus swezeyi TaxID=1925020 RepID=UPI002E1C1306|nr:hypothetical protein [Bacillus swezeyi]